MTADEGRVQAAVYPRDHSSVNARPSTTHGAYAMHTPSASDPGVAACDSRITLWRDGGVSVDSAPFLCRRRGCIAASRDERLRDA